MGDKQRAMTRNKVGPQFMAASGWGDVSAVLMLPQSLRIRKENVKLSAE